MKSELFFEIPDDREIKAKLVESVPDGWAWIDGRLAAPEELIASGEAEETSQLVLQRFHSIQPTIVGAYDRDTRTYRTPNLFAIFVDRKLPGSVRFDEAGYDWQEVVTFELSRRIAVAFLQRGYGGELDFFRDCHDNRKYLNSARCSFVFQTWHGPPILDEEAGPQPARVRLRWDGRYRGKSEDIEPIVAVCRSFGLREYVPAPIPHQAVL